MRLNWTNWRHGAYTAAIQFTLGWAIGFWHSGALAVALFYGREHAQEQEKQAKTLKISVTQLPALSCVNVFHWHPDSKRDFWVPVAFWVVGGVFSEIAKLIFSRLF